MNTEYVADHIEDLTVRLDRAVENLQELNKAQKVDRLHQKIATLEMVQESWTDMVDQAWISGDVNEVFHKLGEWVDAQQNTQSVTPGAREAYSLVKDYLRSYR